MGKCLLGQRQFNWLIAIKLRKNLQIVGNIKSESILTRATDDDDDANRNQWTFSMQRWHETHVFFTSFSRLSRLFSNENTYFKLINVSRFHTVQCQIDSFVRSVEFDWQARAYAAPCRAQFDKGQSAHLNISFDLIDRGNDQLYLANELLLFFLFLFHGIDRSGYLLLTVERSVFLHWRSIQLVTSTANYSLVGIFLLFFFVFCFVPYYCCCCCPFVCIHYEILSSRKAICDMRSEE